MSNAEYMRSEIARLAPYMTESQQDSFYSLFERLFELSEKSQTEITKYLEKAFPGADGGEVSEEIKRILATKESDSVFALNTPFFKELIRRNAQKKEIESACTFFANNDIKFRVGKLSVFQKAVFQVLAKAFYEDRVTRDNVIVLEQGQAGRWFTSCSGTPGTVAMQDFFGALYEMRDQVLDYETTADLADIIGLEAAAIADSIQGLTKPGGAYGVTEHIIDKIDVVKNRYKRRGKFVNVYLIKPGNLTLKLLQAMRWYEERPQEFYKFKYMENGKLKAMGYSKKRKTLQTFICDEVFSKQRANDKRGGRSYYADKLPYKKIFEVCELDVTHGTERKNRIEDVKRIFEHLLREGEIYAFSEYSTRTEKHAGIQYQLGANTHTLKQGKV